MFLIAAAFALPPADHAFVSYGALPTWTGVAADWQTSPVLHAYDHAAFQGHASFVSRGLETGFTFKQFKARVRGADRTYVPFFLYDLSDAPVEVGGRTIHWAIRIEDYEYTDDDASLGRTTAKLATLAAKTWDLPVESGLVVLARSTKVRPNEGSAGPVHQAGFVTATLGVLQEAAPPIEVLNPGVTVGFLRDGSGTPGPRDIVFYDELPKRVPPVAGVLTRAPQTPLSHVNLLAKNRGTPNVVVRDPAAVEPLGRWVKLEAGSTLTLSTVTEAEAEAWWTAHPRPVAEIPRADRTVGVVDLKTRPTVEQVGAKAANYGLLQELLPTTRPGWALGFGAYADHASTPAVQTVIDALLTEPQADPIVLGARLAAVRHAIEDTPLDPAVVKRVRQVVTTLGVPRVRLRSSTNNEDLPHFNGAGLYESKGFDAEDSDGKLEKKLKKVFASLWTEHAFAERAFHGVDHREVAMAVLIHEAFRDELANGVALTVPTAAGYTLLVNSQPGEASVANPEAGTRPEALEVRAGVTELEGRSSIGPVFTGPYAALLPELERQIAVVQKALLDRRRAEGDTEAYGVDVEFKIVDGPVLVLKQARLLGSPRVQ